MCQYTYMEHVNEEKTSNTRCQHCETFFDSSDLKAVFTESAEVLLCMACARDLEEGMDAEPPCTCSQTDVDLFDARGCDAHDRNSGYNVRQRAMQAHETVNVFSLSVMEETCPF